MADNMTQVPKRRQWLWYLFQIGVFGSIVSLFIFADDAPNIGVLPILIIAFGITVVATGLVFWTGRLLAWIGRAMLGKQRQADHGRVDDSAIIGSSKTRELSAGSRVRKEPR